MSNPIDDYMRGTKAIPLPPNSQREAELYNSETEKAIEGQTESQTKLAIEINKDLEERYERKRRYEAEKALYESNQQEGDEIEYNSQQELDDLAESASDYDDDDNHLENSKFSGNYFEKPDENEEKSSSLGDRIRAKYDSFSEKISNSAGSVAGSFVSGFNQKMDSFERGDPLFDTKRPATKRRSIRYVSRPSRQNKNLSRPYVGGRFGSSDDFTLGTNAGGYNPYYPVNEGRQSASQHPATDVYLPSGASPYEGEFSGRNAFKQSEFSDERERYDPFGFGMGGRLSADGFDNMSGFGDSLLGGVGDNQQASIFGGMSAGTDTVFGDGAMFNAPRGKAKREANGFGLDMIIGNDGGMFNTIDPSPRKTTTKRKPASKRAKKATKKTATKRKASARKQSSNGFVLP